MLKISAMLAVVVLHVLKQGGILGIVSMDSINYDVAWLVESTAYCAVNCYAIASGFVGINSRHKYTNIALLWIQVAFYTMLALIAFTITFPDLVDKSDIVRAVLPVMNEDYWYFTAYFCLFFFMPFLNEGIKRIGKKEITVIVIVIGVLFSARGVFFVRDAFDLDNGYGVLWLMYLYIIGGFIKKYTHVNKKGVFLLVFAGCTILSWFGKIGIEKYELMDSDSFVGQALFSLIRYTSPTMLIAAISLVLFFSNIEIRSTFILKLIEVLAPISFGVYLIHAEPLVWDNLLNGAFGFVANSTALAFVGEIFVFSVCIFVVCLIVDFVRSKLFKILGVKKRLSQIEEKISLGATNGE